MSSFHTTGQHPNIILHDCQIPEGHQKYKRQKEEDPIIGESSAINHVLETNLVITIMH